MINWVENARNIQHIACMHIVFRLNIAYNKLIITFCIDNLRIRWTDNHFLLNILTELIRKGHIFKQTIPTNIIAIYRILRKWSMFFRTWINRTFSAAKLYELTRTTTTTFSCCFFLLLTTYAQSMFQKWVEKAYSTWSKCNRLSNYEKFYFQFPVPSF